MTKWLSTKLGGAFSDNDSLDGLSNGATKLIEDALEGFETSSPITDYHTYLIGTGAGGTGCTVHPNATSPWKHPVTTMRLKVIESAGGVKNTANWDGDYLRRLKDLKTSIAKSHGGVWGRQCLLALDQYHDKSGSPVPANTGFYIPNEYVYQVAQDNLANFVPCVSIHPYRKDAAEELKAWVKKGIKIVRWMPSTQGIDPSDSKCTAFYAQLVKSKVALHCGGERLLESPGINEGFDNPLHLRHPLSLGVKVIVAHCGSEGKSLDLDDPLRPPIDNLQLFFRLMRDPKYDGLLFGDIGGITNSSRLECLEPLLDRPELHRRLVYGSDYPIPAVNLSVQTYWFANRGLMSTEDSDHLGEIYKINPLLFDFVVKRTIKSKSGNKFNISVFKEHMDVPISKMNIVDDITEEAFSAPPSPEGSPRQELSSSLTLLPLAISYGTPPSDSVSSTPASSLNTSTSLQSSTSSNPVSSSTGIRHNKSFTFTTPPSPTTAPSPFLNMQTIPEDPPVLLGSGDYAAHADEEVEEDAIEEVDLA